MSQDAHPDDRWGYFNLQPYEGKKAEFGEKGLAWARPWAAAQLFPTTGKILIMNDKQNDTIRPPPSIPPTHEPSIEVITRMPRGKFGKMCAKDEVRTSKWSFDTMPKEMAELLYASWQDDITSMRDNNDIWEHSMERYKDVGCVERSFDSFETEEFDLRYDSHCRPC